MKQIINTTNKYVTISVEDAFRSYDTQTTGIANIIAFRSKLDKEVYILTSYRSDDGDVGAFFHTLNDRYWLYDTENNRGKKITDHDIVIKNAIKNAINKDEEVLVFDTLEEFYNWAK